jgi:hypothetical protein
LIKEIEEITSIILNDVQFKINLNWGGDMKFLLNVFGLNAANSNYSCLWCKCPKDQFHVINHSKWSITDTKKGARTIKEARLKKGFGYIESPLTSIEFSKACIDLLHMWLRISDKLEKLLVDKLTLIDYLKAKKNDDLSDKPNLSKYINFMRYECNIQKPYYISNKQIEFRQLSGAEKLKLFESIDITKLFPNLQNVEKVENLWKSFFNIYVSVKNNSYSSMIRVDEIKNNCEQWVNDFIAIYQSVNVTPYIHEFGQHLWEMVKLHGDVSLFTMQGKKKLE